MDADLESAIVVLIISFIAIIICLIANHYENKRDTQFELDKQRMIRRNQNSVIHEANKYYIASKYEEVTK